MKTPPGVHPNRRVFLAGMALAVLLALFWALTLAASSDLHERVHPDANHEAHDCGATLFLSGALGSVLAAVVSALAPPPLSLGFVCLVLPVVWAVRPTDRAVLEHGPPEPSRLAKAI
jgi:hypothetical protein